MSDDFKPHFFEMSYPEVRATVQAMGEKPYRAKQIWSWAYRKFASSFNDMTDFPVQLRERLASSITFMRLQPLLTQEGAGSWAKKYLWGRSGSPLAESVLMRYSYGLSACLSTQAGCPVGCAFCASKILGFERNLTKGEMLEEYVGMCSDRGERIGHVVFMGTGEPFLNYEAVMGCIDTLATSDGCRISRRKITVSTVGIPAAIKRFAKDSGGVRLALSLHAASDETRDQIVPMNRRYPIREVLAALKGFAKETGQRVTVEYMLLKGVNDEAGEAAKLAALLSGIDCLVNLIPWNQVPGLPFERPSRARVEGFRRVLEGNRVKVTIRRSLGEEIGAAVGSFDARAERDKFGGRSVGEGPVLEWSAQSSRGLVRPDNEDAWVVEPLPLPKAWLAVVADGIGGNQGGQVASSMAVKLCAEHVRKHIARMDPESLLDESIRNGNEVILRAGSNSRGFPGMGTTFTGALIMEEERKVYVGHVGDSRAYLVSGSSIRQITDDHSVTGQLMRDGAISEEDAMRHPGRNVLTMALGTQDEVVVSTYVEDLKAGDVVLLCTDGLTSLVSSKEIVSLVNDRPREELAEALVNLANSRGGYDNTTVVVLWPELK